MHFHCLSLIGFVAKPLQLVSAADFVFLLELFTADTSTVEGPQEGTYCHVKLRGLNEKNFSFCLRSLRSE